MAAAPVPRRVKCSSLIEDLSIYPRHAIDQHHVVQLSRALAMGTVLPPITVDRKTNRIVDGVHRNRSHLKTYGPDATIEAIFCSFKNEQEILLAAVAANSSHGLKFAKIDRIRVAVKLVDAGIDKVRIAVALQIPEGHIDRLVGQVALIEVDGPGAVPGTPYLPLKRSAAHFQGQPMTNGQATVHRLLPGTSYMIPVIQLRKALEADMIDFSDDRLLVQFRLLYAQVIKIPGLLSIP